MTDRRFEQLAAYNHWANARIYQAALALPDALYRRDVGVFFRSLHGTLNHLLATDRIWLKRLTGQGEAPNRLDAIVHEDRAALALARDVEDARLRQVIDGYSDAELAAEFTYSNMSGQVQSQSRIDVLTHLFNHQTHHRGQCHACCSILTGAEPPSLDMVQFQRGAAAPSFADIIASLA